ncbi:MAG: aldo/keto reductase, partial [Myxococcaceae bacterium]
WKNEGLSPSRVKAAIDESLQRLGTDYVDLYYLHKPDPQTPIEQTLEAVHGILQAGKARSWGVSNYASWQIFEINALCDARKMPRPRVSQVLYNLLVRQLDIEYFAFTSKHPIHTTVYNPLAGGLLARATTRLSTNKMYARRYASEALGGLRDRYEELAREAGLSLVTLAYAWLAGTKGVDSILAGPGSLPHLDAAIDAVAVPVSAELRTKIDELHRDFLGTDARYAR